MDIPRNTPSNNKILCIDQSTKITAYSLWNGKSLLKYGVLDSSNVKDPYERLKQQYNKFKDLFHKEQPCFVVIEEIHFHRNFKTFQILAQLQGLILSVLLNEDVGFVFIESSAWRSFVGIKDRKRAEQKLSAIELAEQMFSLNDLTDDEAESLLIGHWAVNNLITEQKEVTK